MTIDEIQPVLNPVQASALEQILLLTPARRRPAVAMAFADLDGTQLADAAGIDRVRVWSWIMHRKHKLPFGAAFRFARVLGDVDAQLLFEDWV